MKKKMSIVPFVLVSLAVSVPALAGPPYLCHRFEVGAAASLPWTSGGDPLTGRGDYDIRSLVADTQAILSPSTPIPVRMETLRRAAIYASRDRAVAQALLSTLTSRVDAAERSDRPDAMALFDAGYVIEAFDEIENLARYDTRFAKPARELAAVARSHDPQLFLYRSQALRPDDASIDLALALITRSPRRDEHVRKARSGAAHDQLLADNLVRLQLQ